MKKFIVILLSAFVPLASVASGTDYKTLWKQVQTASEKDQPRSKIACLDKIISAAKREKSYGNLLAAEASRATTYYNISPDSIKPSLNRLKSAAIKASSEPLRAVYNAVIAKIFGQQQMTDSASFYFRRALSFPEVLSRTQAAGYSPLLASGNDSKVFDDDLLHVIGMEAREYRLLANFYSSHDNKAAALVARLMDIDANDSINNKAKMQELDRLESVSDGNSEAYRIALMKDNLWNDDDSVASHIHFIDTMLQKYPVRLYPRMRELENKRKKLTAPSAYFNCGNNIWLPTKKNTLFLNNIRNIQDLHIDIFRLKCNGDNTPGYYDRKKLKSLCDGRPVFSIDRHYMGKTDYELYSDSVVVDTLPNGVYLITLDAPGISAQQDVEIVHVTNLTILNEGINGNKQMRLAVVNSTTGRPVAGAKVVLENNYQWNDKRKKTITISTNKDGEAVYDTDGMYYPNVYVSTSDDKGFSKCGLYSYYDYRKPVDRTYSRVLTDRAIYRPGQKVHAAVIAWTENNGTEARALTDKEITLTLRNANYKVVEEKKLTTNSLGTASADFDIPTTGLTGAFTLNSSLNGATRFDVEEYKRPTFHVDLDEYKKQYNVGDTITVSGHAMTYSGVAVSGAKVEYTVSRSYAWWWRYDDGSADEVYNGTTTTDDNGNFILRMPMTLPSNFNPGDRVYFSITANAKVTSLNGETHEQQTSMPLGTKSTYLTCDLPKLSLADSLQTVTFTRVNMGGKKIDGTINYSIDGRNYTAKANTKVFMPKNLASGEHKMMAVCGNDTISLSFATFKLTDSHPAIETEDWFYQSGMKLSDDIPVYVQAGSSLKDQHIFYTIFEGDKTIETGSTDVSNSIYTRKFTNKYNENLSVNYVWVRNGHVYSHTAKIEKPLPDNHLKLSWSTFRDHLQPGQKETWTLRVVRPDGKPAQAQLISTLYDKSLDQLAAFDWNFSTFLGLPTVDSPWRTPGSQECSGSISGSVIYAQVPDVSYWHIDPKWFDLSFYPYRQLMVRGGVKMKMEASAPMVNMMDTNQASSNEALALADSVIKSKTQPETKKTEQVRTNLQETAFFIPDSQTDDKGNITLSFTLPESVTTWRFMGLAHDSLMRYGQLNADVVAQKKLMVQPNMPRFLRQGDKAEISSVISNTTDKDISVLVTLQLTDPSSDQTVLTKTQETMIPANGSKVTTFSFDTSTFHEMLVCNISAASKEFTDGEQSYLPVLSPYEKVIDTHPFTVDGNDSKTFDLGSMKGKQPRLTLEYTANPSLLVISALHSIAQTDSKNAISIVSGLYANRLGQYILSLNPKMKQTVELWARESNQTSLKSNLQKNEDLKEFSLDDTPWISDAENEEAQRRSLVYFYDDNTISQRLKTAMEQLSKLQNVDGSFSWWPGMKGSAYITLAVARTLVRLEALTGDKDPEIEKLVSSAFSFLDREIAREVIQKKQEQRRHPGIELTPSDFECDYLYASALYQRKETRDMNYLVGLLSKIPTKLTIYGKANSAIILDYFGQKKQSREYLKSMKEYTVYKDQMGRYFDSPNAYYSWFDYRIPTQTVAIEALKRLEPQDSSMVRQMQYWLLQEKRTTQWSTPINTADAVYAFLYDGRNVFNSTAKVSVIIDGKSVTLPSSAAGTGYFRMNLPSDAQTVVVKKTGTGTSWGALYAQYTDLSTNISKTSSGISIDRKIEVGKDAKVGDKVKVVITITAERDYDFVSIADRRPACLEPVDQLSGYNGSCYVEKRDRQTNYFFSGLHKGTRTVSTEYYVDRKGDYHSGTATVQCAYAPEYSGRDKAVEIKVE